MTSTNSNSFEKFSEKHKQWCECLSGKDIHSISNQVYDLTWGAAVWWILINEPRRYAEQLPEGGVAINPAIHNLIDRWFFESQMAAIRRLITGYSLEGGKGVFSLTALLKDIKDNVHLLTRENILRAGDLPYDYEPIREKHDEFICNSVREGKKSGRIPRELDWSASADRHAFLDRLRGVTETSRNPDDIIRPAIIQNMESHLNKACEKVGRYVNKFVAHAATPESRAGLDQEATNMTFECLQNACRTICEVMSFLEDLLDKCATRSFLGMPLAAHFAYLDRPMIESKNLSLLQTAWDEYAKKIDAWGNYRIEEFVNP